MNKQEKSAGLIFMQATAAAIPRTLGDRDSVNVMGNAMEMAVANRFPFKPEDAPELRRLGIETCVGVFRALYEGYYRTACRVGGTYPRMWEVAHGFKPWKAAVAIFTNYQRYSETLLENNRVYKDVGVLMPKTFAAEEPHLANHLGMQVWWVTDITSETINLCRYKPSEGYGGHLRRPGGHPARIRQVSREDFTKFQAETKALWDARLNPDQHRPVFVRPAEAAEVL